MSRVRCFSEAMRECSVFALVPFAKAPCWLAQTNLPEMNSFYRHRTLSLDVWHTCLGSTWAGVFSQRYTHKSEYNERSSRETCQAQYNEPALKGRFRWFGRLSCRLAVWCSLHATEPTKSSIWYTIQFCKAVEKGIIKDFEAVLSHSQTETQHDILTPGRPPSSMPDPDLSPTGFDSCTPMSQGVTVALWQKAEFRTSRLDGTICLYSVVQSQQQSTRAYSVFLGDRNVWFFSRRK